MKICFITSNTITNHATMKRAFGMANPLTDLGHEVTICLKDSTDNREAISHCPNSKAFYYQTGSALQERRYKQSFLEHNTFDVVYICGLGVRNAIQPKPLGNTFVIMDHVELESALEDISLRRRLIQMALEWWSLLSYHGSIVASKYLEFLFLRRLQKLRKYRPLLWLPYAYDPALLKKNPLDVSNLRNKYPQAPIILYMGSFYKNYGCFEMLEALLSLYKQGKIFNAFFLGKGPEKQACINFIEQNHLEKCIHFTGYVSGQEVATYLYSADVLLSPLHNTIADWARCPGKLLIYMATQKPIVTCAIGEAKEYLKKDGFYYTPSSVSSMAKVIWKSLEISHTWSPSYDIRQHTWEARVQTWLEWLYECKPELKKLK